MKKILCFVCFLIFVTCLLPNVINADSLSFYLIPWGDEIRPGGSVLIGKNAIFDADETTVEAWINPVSYATGVGIDEGRTIIWNGDGTGGHDPYWILINSEGYLEARVDYESPYQHRVITSSDILELNVWHHFALVISIDETRLYINGVPQVDIVVGAGSACKGTSYISIGRSMWHWNPFEGFMDEMRIWSFARTEAEIQENMWAGSINGDELGLISYWDFEPDSNLKILYDRTPNHLDGWGLSGNTWAEDNAPVYEPITKADVLRSRDVPGRGIDNAPGLQKPFNPKSRATERAGKK